LAWVRSAPQDARSPPIFCENRFPRLPLRGRFAVLTGIARAHARCLPSLNEKENQMHIKLFRALKAANVSDDAAAEVVEAVEEYIAVKVQEANKTLEAQLKAQTWVIGAVGFVLSIIGLAPALYKLFQ